MAMMPGPNGPLHVELAPMSQLAEAIDSEDDWTGITDPVARRKIQNRLHVRAHRRRKARESRLQGELTSASAVPRVNPAQAESSVPCWNEGQQVVSHLPIRIAAEMKEARRPLIPSDSSASSNKSALTRQTSGGIVLPLSSDHLIVLLQYNVLRALMTNRHIIASFFATSTVTECSSAELHVISSHEGFDTLPASLQPTELQRTVPHEEWVDIIPHPTWRDNILRAIGTFDEDQLWSDTIGGLFEGFPHSEVEQRGVVVWSPPWDIAGWEMSEGFLRNWGWSMENCDDAIRATNEWRVKRGEEPLVVPHVNSQRPAGIGVSR